MCVFMQTTEKNMADFYCLLRIFSYLCTTETSLTKRIPNLRNSNLHIKTLIYSHINKT